MENHVGMSLEGDYVWRAVAGLVCAYRFMRILLAGFFLFISPLLTLQGDDSYSAHMGAVPV